MRNSTALFSTATALLLGLAASGPAAHPAWASPGDSDEGDDDAVPRDGATLVASRSPRHEKPARPVAFEAKWLEPFFQKGPARKAAEDFRLERWSSAESGFLKAAAKMPAGSTERQAARYLAALAKANQNKWSDAAKMFEELYRTYPRLAAYHAYNAARCRLRAGDQTAALTWADRVPDGSVSDAEAALIRIDALRGLGKWSDAAKAAAAYLERFSGSGRRAEVMFKQAEALENAAKETKALEIDADLADITALYRRVWAEAPLDSWSDKAGDRLEAIAKALPSVEGQLVRTHVASEWVTRGMAYFDRNRNAESEAALANALNAPGLTPELECQARYNRAQSVWKQRQRSRAAPLFDDAELACGRSGNADLHTKALYQGARCLASTGDGKGATARYARIEAEHADHSYADDALLRQAEVAHDAGDEETARKLLAQLPEKYPKGDLLGEALWRLALSSWRDDKLDDALHWLDENLKRIPHEDIWYAEGRALYWKARVLERKGEKPAARRSYEQAVREYPLSVYALLSLARLGDGAPQARAALIRELRAKEHPAPFHFAARPLFGEPGFLRAVDLARMGQGGDARRELSRMGLRTVGDKRSAATAKRDEEDLLWITAVLLDRGGTWNASHSIPRYTLQDYRNSYPKGLDATKWRLSYPKAFPELVAANAKANGIPQALQLAIMREESAFSPRIESFANAIGLTQMLIKTAQRFSNGARVTRDFLMDPARNLEVGSRFLAFLWNRFGQAAPLAIAGYNAGEGAVDRWLGERGNLAMDEFMETIPYDETRNYTKRVLASYFAYSWLYDDKHPVPAIPLATRASK